MWVLLDGLENVVVEEAHVLHWSVTALITALVVLKLPMKTLARALAAVVVGEGVGFKEAEEGEQLADTVLEGSSRKTELVRSLEGEDCTGSIAGTVLLRFLLERLHMNSGWSASIP